jgi:hypothetical protein
MSPDEISQEFFGLLEAGIFDDEALDNIISQCQNIRQRELSSRQIANQEYNQALDILRQDYLDNVISAVEDIIEEIRLHRIITRDNLLNYITEYAASFANTESIQRCILFVALSPNRDAIEYVGSIPRADISYTSLLDNIPITWLHIDFCRMLIQAMEHDIYDALRARGIDPNHEPYLWEIDVGLFYDEDDDDDFDE